MKWFRGIISEEMLKLAKIALTLFLLLATSAASAISFKNLDEALHFYQKIEKSGGWENVAEGPKLEEDVLDPRVVQLKQRLLLTGDLENKSVTDPNLFDKPLKEAMIHFQKRHGLTEDGVAGKSTLQALNVSVETRIHQIEANIQREKEAAPIANEKYILVNIPAFHLGYFENKNRILEMRIVVGKSNWETPLFSTQVTGVLFNPTWNIPASIVKKELLPKLKKDPDYLSKEEIEVAENRYFQKPGAKNPLGHIKLLMPNEFDIYLHDTPAKNFFNLSERNLSHGCIRIEKPLDLATLLLKGDSRWSEKKIKETIDAGKEVTAPLPAPIPVYLIYKTVWLDDEGLIHFASDVYKKDESAQ